MYRNRGEVPNISRSDGNGNGGYGVPDYTHFWNGRFIIIKYDKTFVAMELIAVFIVFLLAFAIYLYTYKTSFEDPITLTKSTFLRVQLISIGLSLLFTGLATFLTKSSKEALIKNLKIIALISLITLIALFVFKINLDKKYNKDTFEELYAQYEQTSNKKTDLNINVGLTGVKVLNPKDAYIEESINAYTTFSIKALLYSIIYLFVIILIFYLSHRLSTIEKKKQKLEKDDVVLYDEEENVKY